MDGRFYKGFPRQPDRFCITDVGSTTTKALLFRRATGWRFDRREAPTTVERPQEDVTIGVTRALRALENATGESLLAQDRPAVPYLSTSSAGGGLAMVVTGLVREVTSRSAERVALGGGAILLDVIALDDGRTPYEKIEALARLRPDMVLLAGGFDGDALSGPAFLAELVREAGLRPKLSPTKALPVIYAGNVHARDFVRATLGAEYLFHPVPNIRPAADREDLDPARAAIHEIFMDHVMSQAPGYERLTEWVDRPILPTPAAFARILEHASARLGLRILAVDIGGATTDVFTAGEGRVWRTVSANLGMSYSILNVARTAGIDAIVGALEEPLSAREVWDLIGEKLVAPTALPASREAAQMERAVAVVAVREAVKEHLDVLRGVSLSRSHAELRISRDFVQTVARKSLRREELALRGYDLVIGSGGILSHSPREVAARILLAALRPEKSVELAVDSAFMFPHLGALSEAAPDLAVRLLEEVGLVRLGRAGELARSARAVPGGGPPARDDARDDARAAAAAGGDRVRRGALELARELAAPGEVFVRVGERVGSETLVARSSREFLRPFFLDVAGALRVAPHEAAACLLKRVGDELAEGEVIARHRAGPLRTRSYNAPVAGRIERILPTGVLVVRERPEEARQLVAVHVARHLMVHAEQIRPHLRVAAGQPVERGQWLAAILRSGELRPCPSPVRGRIRQIDLGHGIVTIEPLREELEVRAWLPGRVIAVTSRGCRVTAGATAIDGTWGRGGEAAGLLALGEASPGAVVVRDRLTADEISRLAAAGAAGVIAGSVHLADVIDRELPCTLVVTEGFGEVAMAAEIRASLTAHEGRLTLVDGTTVLRVGVRRPRVILAEE